MRARSYAAIGIAACLAFLAAMVPASYVARQIQGATRGLEVTEARGTIWSGSARMRAVAGATVVTVDELQWRFLPARLLLGEIAYGASLRAHGIAATADVARSFGGWEIRSLAGEGDARAASVLVPLIAAWQPGGTLRFSAPRLAIRGNAAEGEVRVEWSRATSGLSTVAPLGTYEATWRVQGSGGQLSVKTLEGPLRISGQGTTTAPMGIRLSGEARAEPAQAQALEPLLDRIGPRRPDGARAIELRTH